MVDQPHIVCFGAAQWDILAHATGGARGRDVPGRVRSGPGGVALNAAMGLAAAGLAVTLVSAVGDDRAGGPLVDTIAAMGIATETVLVYPDTATGRYVAVERVDGELLAAVADMAAIDNLLPEHLSLDALKPADAWLVDANLPPSTLRAIAAYPGRPPLHANAVSEAKATRLRPLLDQLDGIYCNRLEAEAICAVGLNAARAAAEALVGRGCGRAVVTDRAQPVADAGHHGAAVLRPPPWPNRPATGAGDALMAGHLGAAVRGATPEAALAAGIAAAAALVT
jgi:sugar/nucleoside kinase (ribokinase family)